jgi:PEP-CTERM motif
MKFSNPLAAGLLALGLALAGAPSVHAAPIPAFSISDTTGNTFVTDATAGWEFVVSSPITVTQLGFFDSGRAGPDGLAEAHPVGIYDLGTNLLVSGTVTTADPLTAQFRYVPVTPTPLAPGTYRIGAYFATPADLAVSGAAGFVTVPEITFSTGVASTPPPTGSLQYPDFAFAGFNPGVFGPNFQFETTAVPEPGTLALTALGMLGLLVYLRKRKRADSLSLIAGAASPAGSRTAAGD